MAAGPAWHFDPRAVLDLPQRTKRADHDLVAVLERVGLDDAFLVDLDAVGAVSELL